MFIQSIINQKVLTIENCADEPIHIPGSVQPHGALLAVEEATKLIRFCSANTKFFLGLEPVTLLNKSFAEVLPGLSALLSHQSVDTTPRQVGWVQDKNHFDVIFHRSGPHLVIEVEGAGSEISSSLMYQQNQRMVQLMGDANSLKELCQGMAEEVRKLTGYDRVMVYRFDKDYNGEVYAESREEDMEPFLGLHYPHTDIPVQARELYLRNLVRLIADVQYTPVPVMTMHEAAANDLDLSQAQLRSVSPIHIQYLKNMDIGATLTISLLQDGRLWGLIACHHRSAKAISFAQRQMALLQGHFLSSQIRVRQVAEEYEVGLQVEAHLQQLLNRVDADEDFAQKFDGFTSLCHVANASGVVILHEGKIYQKGLVPSQDKVMALIRWIEANIRSLQFITAHLHSRYTAAADMARQGAGIFYHALGKPTENCIIWFREEVEHTVNWAGNPHDAVQRDGVTNMLMPRSSFALWRERVRYHSREWRVSEVNAASRFATTLQNHFYLLHLRNEDLRLRMVNEKLTKANEELANINWITSHDLKEPLRKIQIFASRIISTDEEQLSDLLRDSIQRIQSSAQRMQLLVEDILSYSLVSDKDAVFVPVNLNMVVQEVVDSLQEEILAKEISFEISSLPKAVRGIPHQLRQIFTNLIGNAIKFNKDERPRIELTCRQVKGSEAVPSLPPGQLFYAISVRDNGAGFDPAFRHRLFDIFFKAHQDQNIQGTGIGLAISKKIAEHHNGAIVGDGEEGKGAVFTLFLPVTVQN